jgi:TRAP-type C4-dicarboxylate transport system substrate-binding protein
MRKCIYVLVSFSVVMLFLFPAMLQAKTINLNYSIFFPATHGQAEAGTAWAREIEKRTDGRVAITVFPGGTLTGANQCYDGVVSGISDIGMSVFAYTRGRFPVMEATDLPLGYPDGIVATRVVNDFYRQVRPQELNDVKVLYLHAHGPGLLHTKKPVRTLNDLQKMKIRSTGLSAKVVEALGGVPVAMPQGETYEALQKGVVEGTFGPIEVLKGWRQAEVIKYTTDCYDVGYTTCMFVVMNLNKWNALPPDIQRIFDEVSTEWIDVHGKVWNDIDAEGRSYTLSLGNEIIPLSAEQQKLWRSAVRTVIDEYVVDAEKKGLDGQNYVDLLFTLIKKYSAR